MTVTKREAAEAIDSVFKNFISSRQLNVIGDLCRGEEAQFFLQKIIEFTDRISNMPKTYEQDGMGDKAVAHLHYFTPNADFYIIEKDIGDQDGPNGPQHQAYGLVSLHGEYPEKGYISLPEIFAAGAELDLHFTPDTIENILTVQNTDNYEGENAFSI